METRKLHVRRITDRFALQTMMRLNNPRKEPVGILTGRCHLCGSRSVWANDHPAAFGCNSCGFSYPTDRST